MYLKKMLGIVFVFAIGYTWKIHEDGRRNEKADGALFAGCISTSLLVCVANPIWLAPPDALTILAAHNPAYGPGSIVVRADRRLSITIAPVRTFIRKAVTRPGSPSKRQSLAIHIEGQHRSLVSRHFRGLASSLSLLMAQV